MNSIPAKFSFYIALLGFIVTVAVGFFSDVPLLILLLRGSIAFLALGLLANTLIKMVLTNILNQAVHDINKKSTPDIDLSELAGQVSGENTQKNERTAVQGSEQANGVTG